MFVPCIASFSTILSAEYSVSIKKGSLQGINLNILLFIASFSTIPSAEYFESMRGTKSFK
jgi:hypothetical protein